MKRYTIKTIILLTFTISILIIFFISVQAINSTDNPKYFTLDFNEKSHIISSFATFLGAILAFLSIIFIYYNILQQKWQFEDEISQQKNQVEEDKINKKKVEDEDLLYRIKLVNHLVSDISIHIIEQGILMKDFYESELESPFKAKILSFKVNKSYIRLVEMDTLTLYKAFQRFVVSEDFSKDFTNLNKIIDFYSESIQEHWKKSQAHIGDKSSRLKEYAKSIQELINYSTSVIGTIKATLGQDYPTNKWYIVLNELLYSYYNYLSENQEEETDLDFISQKILKPFIQTSLDVKDQIGDPYNIEIMLMKTSKIRKDLYSLRFELIVFAEHIKSQYDNYYSQDSDYYKKLLLLNENLIKSISNASA